MTYSASLCIGKCVKMIIWRSGQSMQKMEEKGIIEVFLLVDRYVIFLVL